MVCPQKVFHRPRLSHLLREQPAGAPVAGRSSRLRRPLPWWRFRQEESQLMTSYHKSTPPPLPPTPVLHLYLCCVLMIMLYNCFRVLSDRSELEMSTSFLTEASFLFFHHGWCRDLPGTYTLFSVFRIWRKKCGNSAVCGRVGELSGKIADELTLKVPSGQIGSAWEWYHWKAL